MGILPRHQVDENALDEAVEDFADRLAREVSGAMNSGREMNSWDLITRTILDYVGARSMADPRFAQHDTRTALRSAVEAAVGMVALDWHAEAETFEVFVSYVNSGVVYEPREPSRSNGGFSVHDWLVAFRLQVIAGRPNALHAETMSHSVHSLPDPATMGSSPERVLTAYAKALDEYLCSHPDHAKVTALLEYADGARGRFAVEIAAFRALVSSDRAAFDQALTELLTAHREDASGTDPASLIDYRSLALARLAYMKEDWTPGVTSDYIPEPLVTGTADRTPESRVGPFGTAKTTLPSGGLTVARPDLENRRPWDDYARKIIDTVLDERVPTLLELVISYQLRRLWSRSIVDPNAEDVRQWHAVALAAAAAAAAAKTESTPEDAEVEVVFGTCRGRVQGFAGRAVLDYHNWLRGASFALIARDGAALAEIAGGDDEALFRRAPRECDGWYVRAMLDFIRGDDPSEHVQRALDATKILSGSEAEFVNARVVPPLMLLSQLAVDDAEAFCLALADGLEAWRDYHTSPGCSVDDELPVAIHLLGLACAAYDRGYAIALTSDFLPHHLLDATWVGTPVDVGP